MVYEATKIEDMGILPVKRTCSSTATISKGEILILTGVNNVCNTSGGSLANVFGGIACADKGATDTSTEVGAHLFGVFDAYVDSACKTGDLLVISGTNLLAPCKNVVANLSGGRIVGKAEEDGTAGTAIRVRLIGY